MCCVVVTLGLQNCVMIPQCLVFDQGMFACYMLWYCAIAGSKINSNSNNRMFTGLAPALCIYLAACCRHASCTLHLCFPSPPCPSRLSPIMLLAHCAPGTACPLLIPCQLNPPHSRNNSSVPVRWMLYLLFLVLDVRNERNDTVDRAGSNSCR